MALNIDGAIASWKGALGEAAVVTAPEALSDLMHNASGFRPRRIRAWLQPTGAEQVVAIVRAARECEVPLYPFSTGRNWGLGSKMPVEDDCALVDLRKMRQIRSVDVARHCAIIEPGVTQRELCERVASQKLMVNVTGSSPDSSLVGNVIERGTGFTLHRTEDLRGVEIVLGTGERVRTGYWADQAPTRPAQHYKYGIGPYLDGLFTESNFGIVTAVVMNLVPLPDAMQMFLFTYEEGALEGVLAELSALFTDGTLRWIVHMFNDKRMSAVNANRGDTPKWTGVGSIGGSPAYVAFAAAELARRLGPLSTSFHLVGESQAEAEGCDPIVRGLYQLHVGRPNTTFMGGMYNSLAGVPRPESPDDLDQSRFGMLACLPLYPMDGKQVIEALRCVDEVCGRHGIVPAVTLNPIDADCLESVVNIYFDRGDAAARERAHVCNEELHRTLHARGFRFYRVDIENMKHVMSVESSYWKTVHRLKTALDPANIIAPGRYCI